MPKPSLRFSRKLLVGGGSRPLRRYALAAALVAGLAVGGSFALHGFLVRRAMARADAFLKEGFSALASRSLLPYEATLVQSEAGCRLLIRSYFEADTQERLNFAAESCLSSGHELLEAYFVLSHHLETLGRDSEAIAMLNLAATKHANQPEAYYRLAKVLRRVEHRDEAALAYWHSTELDPSNDELATEALTYMSQVGHWVEAVKLADRLKDLKTNSPERKLRIARALIHSLDRNAFKAAMNDTMASLDGVADPLEKERLRRTFADVLQAQQTIVAIEREHEKSTQRTPAVSAAPPPPVVQPH